MYDYKGNMLIDSKLEVQYLEAEPRASYPSLM